MNEKYVAQVIDKLFGALKEIEEKNMQLNQANFNSYEEDIIFHK